MQTVLRVFERCISGNAQQFLCQVCECFSKCTKILYQCSWLHVIQQAALLLLSCSSYCPPAARCRCLFVLLQLLSCTCSHFIEYHVPQYCIQVQTKEAGILTPPCSLSIILTNALNCSFAGSIFKHAAVSHLYPEHSLSVSVC